MKYLDKKFTVPFTSLKYKQNWDKVFDKTTKEDEMVELEIELDDITVEEIKKQADAEGKDFNTKASEMVREVLEKYVEDESFRKQVDEKLKQKESILDEEGEEE